MQGSLRVIGRTTGWRLAPFGNYVDWLSHPQRKTTQSSKCDRKRYSQNWLILWLSCPIDCFACVHIHPGVRLYSFGLVVVVANRILPMVPGCPVTVGSRWVPSSIGAGLCATINVMAFNMSRRGWWRVSQLTGHRWHRVADKLHYTIHIISDYVRSLKTNRSQPAIT